MVVPRGNGPLPFRSKRNMLLYTKEPLIALKSGGIYRDVEEDQSLQTARSKLPP